jgi:nucleoside-diphosphate-sugar epimerase
MDTLRDKRQLESLWQAERAPREGVGMSLNFMDAFRDRSVFLTGHTGFKGSWLTLWLNRLGARVTGYSLTPPSEPSNFMSSKISGSLARSYNADAGDFAALRAALDARRAARAARTEWGGRLLPRAMWRSQE